MGQNRTEDSRGIPFRLKPIIWLLVGMLLLFWTQRLWFVEGVPFTHDGQLHLTRMAHYYLSLKDGQFLPRIAGNLNNSFGYPVFNFNYPLPQMLAAPFIGLFKLPIVLIYKIIALTMLMAAFGGMFLLGKSFGNNKAGFLAACVYGFSSYGLSLLYVRGSIGELLAYGLFPWVLWLYGQQATSVKMLTWKEGVCLAVLWGVYLLSHNVMVMLTTPILLGYLIYISKSKNTLKPLAKVMLPLFTGFMLAAFFWIPALFEKQFTILDSATLSSGFTNHFPTLKELLFSPWGYGFSYIGPVDGLSFSVGPAGLLLWIIALGWGLKNKQKKLLLLWGLITLVGIMMLSFSLPLWRIIPMIHFIQFPWRWLFVMQLLMAILAGWLVAQTPRWSLFWGLFLLLLIIQGDQISQPQGLVSTTNAVLYNLSETSSTSDENMPIWFDKTIDYQLKSTLFEDQPVSGEKPTTSITVKLWTSRIHSYNVNAQGEDRIIEKLAYFPGWEVWVDNQLTPIDMKLSAYPGLVTYKIGPGDHQIITKLTQNTPPRIIGNSLSLLGILLIVSYPWLIPILRKKRP